MNAMHTEINMATEIFDVKSSRLWASGLAEALAETQSTGKYLLIAAGAEPAQSWKLGVALAFMDESVIALSRKFHCVIVNESNNGQHVAGRPTLMICTPDGREIVSAVAESIEELIPALRGMMEHVVQMDQPKRLRGNCTRPTLGRLSLRHFVGAVANAILG